MLIVSFLLFACQKKEEDPEVFNRKQLFTEDWKFYKNDTLNSLTEVLNSEDWRPIDVPHDWSIHQEFDKNSAAGIGGGALSGGVGYYKKSFNLPLEDSARLYKIQFDGVYQNSEVWINGSYLGKRPNGYIGFEYDLTPYLHYGSQDNTIVVKADNSDQPNSRWYSGSGIYRNVWLKKLNKIHIPNWGTFITTPSISKEKALVNITAKIKNEFLEDKEIEVVYHLGSYTDNRYSKQILALSTRATREEIPNPGNDSTKLPSLRDIFYSVEFHERECFEMLGVYFDGHPDNRRLLLPEDWADLPPLRKDFRNKGR